MIIRLWSVSFFCGLSVTLTQRIVPFCVELTIQACLIDLFNLVMT